MAAFAQTYPRPNQYEQAPVYPGGGGIDLKQSVVLSARELGHIDRVSRNSHAAEQEAAKKAQLRTRSQARYQNWGNTLEALREKKKRDRVKRLNQIEDAQSKIDDQESEYLEQQRRAAIDKANRLLYQQNDRVKSFTSAELLSTAMQERQKQIEITRRKKQQEGQMEQMWVQIQNENLKEQYAKEEEEEKVRKKKSLELASTQLQQLQEFRVRQKQERQEEIRDGERNKRIAEEALAEQRELEKIRKERMVSNNKEYLRANIEQRKIKSERQRLEALEDAKIAEFAKEKERLVNLRKEAEAARFRNKQDSFEAMLARQHDHLKMLRAQEQGRVEKQVMEIKERNDTNLRLEEERQKRLQDSIVRSRTDQMARRARDVERQRMEDQMMADEWARRGAEMEKMDALEEERTRQQALELQAYLDAQKTQKLQAGETERMKTLEAAKLVKQRMDEEDDIFLQYANTRIQDFATKGRSVVPMKLDLAKHERAKTRLARA